MFIREPAQRCSMGICSIIRMSPGGGLVICEEVGVRALGRRERIVIERRAWHRAVIPALRLEIGRDLRRLENAAVARKNFIAGKAALLPREVRHVRLREPARGAVRQDVAAGGRRRRGAGRPRSPPECPRSPPPSWPGVGVGVGVGVGAADGSAVAVTEGVTAAAGSFGLGLTLSAMSSTISATPRAAKIAMSSALLRGAS